MRAYGIVTKMFGIFVKAFGEYNAARADLADGDDVPLQTNERGEVLSEVTNLPADRVAADWTVARDLVAQVAEPGAPDATVVTGATDLTAYVYPGAFDGTTIEVNGESLTFAAGDPTDEVSLVAAIAAAFPDVVVDIDTVGGRFLRLSYNGNLELAGTLLAAAGMIAAEYGEWVDIGQSPVVELSWQDLAVTGAPDALLVRAWRALGGVTDMVGEVRIDAAELETTAARRFWFDAQQVQLTVDFEGGVAPTVTGQLLVRTVFDGGSESGSASPSAIRTEWVAVAALQTTSNLAATAVGGIAQLDPTLTQGGTFRFLASVYASAGRQVSVELYNVDDAVTVAGTSFTTGAVAPTVVSAVLEPGVTAGFPAAPRQYEVRIWLDGGLFPDAVFCQSALVENVV